MTRDIRQHKIKTRKVFYIPGFDPLPPRRYRELYRKEGAKQAQISGYELKQKTVAKHGASTWQVQSVFGNDHVTTDFQCLIWSDLVKASMKPSFWNIYFKSFYFFANYITTGALLRIMKVRLGPAIVALYPPLVTLAQLLIGLALALTIYALIAAISVLLATTAALIAVILFFKAMRYLDKYLYAHYLMLDYTFFSRGRGAMPEGLSEKLDQFMAQVEVAEANDYDEILIIGHSSGAQLAVNLAAKILRQNEVKNKLGVMTLGHSIPMSSFLPEAQYMRQDLQYLSEHRNVTWLDVSAPADGACFALADPVAISGVRTDKQIHPKVISAAFSKTLSQTQLDALRFRFFKKHFQYLCAFEHPDLYDYFLITAGPKPFADFVGGLKDSPSKIDQSYSGYVDV